MTILDAGRQGLCYPALEKVAAGRDGAARKGRGR